MKHSRMFDGPISVPLLLHSQRQSRSSSPSSPSHPPFPSLPLSLATSSPSSPELVSPPFSPPRARCNLGDQSFCCLLLLVPYSLPAFFSLTTVSFPPTTITPSTATLQAAFELSLHPNRLSSVAQQIAPSGSGISPLACVPTSLVVIPVCLAIVMPEISAKSTYVNPSLFSLTFFSHTIFHLQDASENCYHRILLDVTTTLSGLSLHAAEHSFPLLRLLSGISSPGNANSCCGPYPEGLQRRIRHVKEPSMFRLHGRDRLCLKCTHWRVCLCSHGPHILRLPASLVVSRVGRCGLDSPHLGVWTRVNWSPL